MDRTVRTDPAADAPDDAALAQLVKDLAAGWTMPPRRLDEVPWSERVHQPRSRLSGVGAGWTRRLVGATALALVATVGLAGMAVWLTSPRRDPGPVAGLPTAGASATASAAPASSAAVTPSGGPTSTEPLPKLVRLGTMPSVTRVLVADGGTHRLVDLTTGDTSPALFPRHDNEYAALPRPTGGWVCICGDYRATGAGADPTSLTLTLEPVDAAGVRGQPVKVRTVTGTLDPKATSGEQGQAVDATVTVSPDARVAFIGWSYRGATGGWVAGVDVVDLATLATLATVELPSVVPASTVGEVWSRLAPSVAVSPSGGLLLISSAWYVSTSSPSVPSGTDHWTAVWDGRQSEAVVKAGSSTSDTCGEDGAGFVDDRTTFFVCWWYPIPAIERHGLDGGLIDRVDLPAGTRGTEQSAALLTVAPDAVYAWQTRDRTIARYDLKAGTVLQAQAPEPLAVSSDAGMLARLGRQLGNAIAPPVAAKVFLQPGLVLSPDGSRVYALGTVTRDGVSGSQGVFVFDARSLQPVGHWAPTADFMSIAISEDGGSLYAAGMAGVDAAGVQRWTLGYASITVFDTADGSVRLIAGEVAPSDIWFPDAPVGVGAGASR